MTQQEAYNRMIEVVKSDYRHSDYERTTKVAEWGYSMMTGENQGAHINLRLNESDAQKEQRERLYNSITGLASGQVASIFKKVRRTDGVQEMIEHDDPRQKEQLRIALAEFHGADHLREYLFDRLEYLTFFDPNAWIICERRNVQTAEGVVALVEPYPLEVSSANAIDYRMDNGRIEYLITDFPYKAMKGDKEVEMHDFYLYHTGYTLHFHEYADGEEMKPGYTQIDVLKDDNTTSRFFFAFFDTGSQEFPGDRAGCYIDPHTQGRTFWTPLHYAEKVFNDLMTDKANHDIGRTVHHYPQKYVYAPICKWEDQETGERCSNGMIEGKEGHKCPQCNGKGALYHVSDQDVVVIAYDADNPEQSLPPLSNFAFYVNLPEWLPKWMAEQIKEGVDRVFSAVFATQIDARQSPGPQTATEVVLDYEQAYAVLQPYGELYSRLFEVLGRTAAQYLELNPAGLTVMHRFPKDFKMETTGQLLEKYKQAKDAGVSMEVQGAIERDILAKMHRNDPERVANWEAFQKFMPFRDKTPEMTGFILSARSETDPDRVLYENFATIREEVQDGLDVWFYLLPFTEQKALIMQAVQAKIGQIQYASAQFQQQTQVFE